MKSASFSYKPMPSPRCPAGTRTITGGLQDLPQVLRTRLAVRARPRGSRAGAAKPAPPTGPGRRLRAAGRRRGPGHQGSRQGLLRAPFHAQRRGPQRAARPADRLLRAGAGGLAHAAGRVPDADLQAPAGSREPGRRDAARRGQACRLTHARKTDNGRRAVSPRAPQIEQGALKGKGLELSTSPIRSRCSSCRSRARAASSSPTAASMRVHYDGKNGHPYSSIGRYLIDKGLLAADKVSMGALKQVAASADPERGKHGHVAERVLRVLPRAARVPSKPRARWAPCNAPLTPGRSLAVDPGHPCARHADLRQRRRA